MGQSDTWYVAQVSTDALNDAVPPTPGRHVADPVAPGHAALSQPAASATSASGNPFEPAGVSFRPVSPSLATVRIVGELIFAVVGVIAFSVGALLLHPGLWAGVAASVLYAVWAVWLTRRQVAAMGYALEDGHLLWRKGVMFRSLTVVPYGRMQYVDTSQGPIARHFGVAEVRLHTASASTDAVINGLPVAEAEELRRILSERGEERMSGL